MKTHQPTRLTRDCDSIQIPSGTPIRLAAGTSVMITQSLGGTYTVTTDHGYMVRIAEKDIDALGLETDGSASPSVTPSAASSREEIERLVWEQLRTCYDPEIPVNIVELGLVYHCEVRPLAEGEYAAEVKMTLTAPGCGMGSVIAGDAEAKITRIAGIRKAHVDVVFEPPWNPGMMSDAARLELGMT